MKSVENKAVLTLTIMNRGCELKQARSRCQSHQQNCIIFGNDYIPILRTVFGF
jgi:hypothetical protein